jgi:two-component system, chemotaxis family, chemotaxis protein CheY
MPRTILVVDDSASLRQAVSMTLSDEGFSVIEAENGADAAAKLDGRPVALMFVDLHMPKMDGIEFIRHVRASGPYAFVPIVMLTTESQLASRQQGSEAGATGWMVKPFRSAQLVDTVRRVLGD